MNTIAELIESAHENARAKGFWSDLESVGCEIDWGDEPNPTMKAVEDMAVAQKLALISTEVAEFEAEAFERRPDAMLDELADVVIRVFDLAGFLDLEVADSVLSGRLHVYSMASVASSAMYHSVAMCVQHHRKSNEGMFVFTLEEVIRIAQDYASYLEEDNYALRRAVETKMEANKTRPLKHGANY